MPAASAYRRAPLVNPAYVPLSDAALHPEGTMKNRIQQVLNMVSPRHMSTLDSVLATKLGGYAQLPPMPDVEAAAALLPADPSRFVEIVWSASMLAAMSRDKEGMLRVLGAMRAFAQALPQLSEEALFACGADALRLTVDLYRRTGQPFLLNLLETMRGQLPDVSGLMHMFPFQREYRRESRGTYPEEKAFYDRMDRFAMGKGAADALAMTVVSGPVQRLRPGRGCAADGSERPEPLSRNALRRVCCRPLSGGPGPRPGGGAGRAVRADRGLRGRAVLHRRKCLCRAAGADVGKRPARPSDRRRRSHAGTHQPPVGR